jgi:hypothetical protein
MSRGEPRAIGSLGLFTWARIGGALSPSEPEPQRTASRSSPSLRVRTPPGSTPQGVDNSLPPPCGNLHEISRPGIQPLRVRGF